jgi:hypothetical protein
MRRSSALVLLLGACARAGTEPAVVGAASPPASDVAAEDVCPTKDVHGYAVHRGEAAGANAAEAIAAARSAATRGLLERACAGYGEVRCEAVLRHVKPWKEGWYDPGLQSACASVSVAQADLDTLARDEAVLESHLRALAAAAAEKAGSAPLVVTAPVWASGCASGTVGDALAAGLQNALATFPAVKLVEPEAAPATAQRLRLELAPGATGVTLTALLQGKGATMTPLPGFSFPLDLFVTDPSEAGTCRSDADLGLAHGERLGAGGLRVLVEVPGIGAAACEGGVAEPIVRVNRPASVQVFSVAKDGRSLLVWPPPGGDPRVEREISLGQMHLVAQPEQGDERLVAVAVPEGASFGASDGWQGFCEVAGGVGPESWPADAAVAAATFTIVPAGTGACKPVAGLEKARAKVVLPPACR